MTSSIALETSGMKVMPATVDIEAIDATESTTNSRLERGF
jgi:hypothetical protein